MGESIDKFKPTHYEIYIRRLVTLFRITATIYIEPVEFSHTLIEGAIFEGTNEANFMFLDNRNSDYPRFTAHWDVEFSNKKVQKFGISEFEKYYNKQIETTIKSKAMALINAKNDDIGLRYLSQIKLNILEDDDE